MLGSGSSVFNWANLPPPLSSGWCCRNASYLFLFEIYFGQGQLLGVFLSVHPVSKARALLFLDTYFRLGGLQLATSSSFFLSSCRSSAGIKDAQCHMWLLMWFPGIELRFSGLHGKHSPHAFSLVCTLFSTFPPLCQCTEVTVPVFARSTDQKRQCPCSPGGGGTLSVHLCGVWGAEVGFFTQ